jgi:hypothetical protein
MSLINDALKRAKQTQSAPPPPLSPLPPAENKSSGGTKWILLLLILLLVIAASFFIGIAMSRHLMMKADFAMSPTEIPMAAPAATPIPPPNVEPVSNSVPEPKAVPVPITPVVPPPPANMNLPGTNAVAAFKIQGIVYDLKKPWAIISGKTVFVGDRVNGFQVKTISKNTVTLTDDDGAEKILSFGQ